MSALARYFMHEGKRVAGYDRTPTPLTAAIEQEGAEVNYEDSADAIPAPFRDKNTTIVVYTPAVPSDHSQMVWFREQGFEVVKRSQMLGYLAQGKYVMAVAGTHGKTTTSTLVSWLNYKVTDGGNAFLGGISKNFGSNLVLGGGERIAVEADEFDRSFLTLSPNVAVVTSTDADHLDIYGTHDEMRRAFGQFVERIKAGGTLVAKWGLNILHNNNDIRTFTYSVDNVEADFYATNIRPLGDGTFRFDIHCPDHTIENLHLGIGGRVNIENAVAATAAVWSAGEIDEEGLRRAMDSFCGVKRRFECYINTPTAVYIDDYAHHPEELRAAIVSIKGMFPGRRLTIAFQPHLYTRTRDFYKEFAEALSLADEVLLLPIYPARELPIEGVESEMIGRLMTAPWRIVEKARLADEIGAMSTDVVVTFGAGDIDRECDKVAEAVKLKIES